MWAIHAFSEDAPIVLVVVGRVHTERPACVCDHGSEISVKCAIWILPRARTNRSGYAVATPVPFEYLAVVDTPRPCPMSCTLFLHGRHPRIPMILQLLFLCSGCIRPADV